MAPGSSVEDRTETRGAVRFARNLRGTGSNLGFQLAHSEFDLDLSLLLLLILLLFVWLVAELAVLLIRGVRALAGGRSGKIRKT